MTPVTSSPVPKCHSALERKPALSLWLTHHEPQPRGCGERLLLAPCQPRCPAHSVMCLNFIIFCIMADGSDSDDGKGGIMGKQLTAACMRR